MEVADIILIHPELLESTSYDTHTNILFSLETQVMKLPLFPWGFLLPHIARKFMPVEYSV